MRVVILSETFSRKMGYLENTLTKYLARLGVDLHLITMDLLPYYQLKDFQESYGGFTGSEKLVPGSVESYDGYTLHVLGHRRVLGYMRMVGLWKKLASLRPDIVQALAAIGWLPLDATLAKPFLGYKLFTGSHTTASVFPLARREYSKWGWQRLRCLATRAIPGRLASLATEKCYAVTEDCADIAQRFFGVQRQKLELMYLGVDTDWFAPDTSADAKRQRLELREQLGFGPDDIVCIYTGKFAEAKNPVVLAQATEQLRSMGHPFRGLFIGAGVQAEALRQYGHCAVLEFMPFQELSRYYRAADIGVWPTQESTSMLDAAACGLPLVVSDGIVYRRHVEGNGIVYRMNDVADLAHALLQLRCAQERWRLGSIGAAKMAAEFSVEAVARRRLRDYEAALNFHGSETAK